MRISNVMFLSWILEVILHMPSCPCERGDRIELGHTRRFSYDGVKTCILPELQLIVSQSFEACEADTMFTLVIFGIRPGIFINIP